jgi:DNA-binding CsgD family transcriptional regulator
MERGRQNLGGPQLPAPRRIRLVASRRGAAGRRPALLGGGHRAPGGRSSSTGPRAAAGADPRPRAAGPHPLQTAPAVSPKTPRQAEAPAPYGLTERELAVLRLLVAGRTNAQIGAELYISPRTAGVHVTNILRKLGVSNRVQAAALAEHAGLCHPRQG